MPDIGWSELLVIAIIAIVVVGPRELPNLMRMIARASAAARRAAAEFRTAFEELAREAEIEETQKKLLSMKSDVMRGIDPTTGHRIAPESPKSSLPEGDEPYTPPSESEPAESEKL